MSQSSSAGIYYDGGKAWMLELTFQHGKLIREKWVRSPEHDGKAL